jgi:uncharacterized membrane protein YphA (DoxX/SURF4 family)
MKKILALKNQRVPLFWVALLRIMLGLLFLTTWASNLSKGFYTPEGVIDFFENIFPQSQNPLTWYAAFIQNIILPSRSFFAPIQLVGEFLLGLFLLVGFLTPLTSVAAAFFIINTFFATYGHDWPWSYLTILSILGVVFFTRAGRSLGIDAWLLQRRGKPPFWPLW